MAPENDKERLAQVVQNFFLKATNIIIQSRTSPLQDSTINQQKSNKWFAIETQRQTASEELKPWASSNQPSFAPLIVETYLDLRELTVKQSLVIKDEENNTWNVNTRKTEIVMERWLVELDPNVLQEEAADIDVPCLYKHLIITFRYLYTVSRLLPTSKLFRSLEKVKLTKSPLKIGARVLEGNRSIVSKGRVGLSKPIIPSTEDHLNTRQLAEVPSPVGTFKISVSYRKHIEFQLIDNEETLSSHFLQIDKVKTNTAALQKRAFRAGTGSPPPVSSSPRSNVSIIRSLKSQRGNSIAPPSLPKSITSSVGSNHQIPIPEPSSNGPLSSSGGTSKYSSSFQKLARRSTMRRSSSIDRGNYSSSLQERFSNKTNSANTEDDLKEFMDLLESKQDLKLSYSPAGQDSLLRFQSMRSQNDQLSESLSASMLKTMNQANSHSHAHSHSHSHSIPQISSNSPNNSSALQSLLQYSGSPRWGISGSINTRLSDNNISNESIMLRESSSRFQSSSRVSSQSPTSAIMKSSNRSFSVGPSNPTIATTPATAKMHRENTENKPEATPATTTNDDEEDLLFIMSDMNLSKEREV